MTDSKWIGDFHKALEERKEPKAEPPAPAAQPAPSPKPEGLADWVKRMGGTLARDTALDNGPASISRAQITAADWPWRIIRS